MEKSFDALVNLGDLSSVARNHSLERTSPKGQDFVGRCVQCGTTGLTTPFGECKNPNKITVGDAIIAAIEGEPLA